MVDVLPPQDERLGLPSVSSFQDYFACLGKFQAEKTAPKGYKNPAAIQGELIHEALEKNNFSRLGMAARKIAEELRLKKMNAVLAWKREIKNKSDPLREESEVRIFYVDINGKKTYSGKPDYTVRNDEEALILDYKAGDGLVPHPAENEQLWAQAVLLRHKYPSLNSIAIGVIQKNREIILHFCCKESLLSKEIRINEMIRAINQFEPKRTAGPQCFYCRVVNCELRILETREAAKMHPIGISPEEKSKRLDLAFAAKGWAKLVEEDAKISINRGIEIPNWYLTDDKYPKLMRKK